MSVDRIKYLQTPNLPKTPIGDQSGSGMTEAVKRALLDCFAHVGWQTENDSDYYDALENALYSAPLVSISAAFTQGQNVVYDTDSLDSLRQYLVVTALYGDSTSKTITGYTLSGTLAEGTSVITVEFSGQSCTFEVTVTENAGTLIIPGDFSTWAIGEDATASVENGEMKMTAVRANSYAENVVGSPCAFTLLELIGKRLKFNIEVSTSGITNGLLIMAFITVPATPVTVENYVRKAYKTMISTKSASYTYNRTVEITSDMFDGGTAVGSDYATVIFYLYANSGATATIKKCHVGLLD